MKANKYLLLITLIIGLGAGTAQAQNDLKVPLSDPGSPGKLVLSTVFSEDIVISAYDGNEVIILFDGEDEDELRKYFCLENKNSFNWQNCTSIRARFFAVSAGC